ncbi:DUF835 domain-containing protein [Thermococcus barophilus]|uniref:DUF835 domain-containing protein n=1 Tax=Thermococcus barophilus TaxID=55802 RepID=UPI00130E4AF7|nr:DUF835 domain-containing protein [Thermococcus barophilus]
MNITPLLYRTLLFVFIFLFTVFLGIRIKKYPLTLRKPMILATLFTGIGALGRFIDLLALFISVPYYSEIHIITHILSVCGIIAVFIMLIFALERYYIPLASSLQQTTSEEKKFASGAYVVFSKDRLIDVIEMVKDIKSPTLVITRSPHIYESMKTENLITTWVTQVPGKGIPPTALHVIGDMAIKFAEENKNATVIIDCIEYLILYNDFKAVFKFLVNIKDYLMVKNATLIIFADRDSLSQSEISLILKEFEPL